ncbi:hypothetical protein KCU70_g219, partial [Aureobasidium melanogenum]
MLPRMIRRLQGEEREAREREERKALIRNIFTAARRQDLGPPFRIAANVLAPLLPNNSSSSVSKPSALEKPNPFTPSWTSSFQASKRDHPTTGNPVPNISTTFMGKSTPEDDVFSFPWTFSGYDGEDFGIGVVGGHGDGCGVGDQGVNCRDRGVWRNVLWSVVQGCSFDAKSLFQHSGHGVGNAEFEGKNGVAKVVPVDDQTGMTDKAHSLCDGQSMPDSSNLPENLQRGDDREQHLVCIAKSLWWRSQRDDSNEAIVFDFWQKLRFQIANQTDAASMSSYTGNTRTVTEASFGAPGFLA